MTMNMTMLKMIILHREMLKTQNDRLEYPSTILELSTGDFDEGDIVLPEKTSTVALKKTSFVNYCICFSKTVIKNKITKYK